MEIEIRIEMINFNLPFCWDQQVLQHIINCVHKDKIFKYSNIHSNVQMFECFFNNIIFLFICLEGNYPDVEDQAWPGLRIQKIRLLFCSGSPAPTKLNPSSPSDYRGRLRLTFFLPHQILWRNLGKSRDFGGEFVFSGDISALPLICREE